MYATSMNSYYCMATLQYIMFQYLVLNTKKCFFKLSFDQFVTHFPYTNISKAKEPNPCS